MARKSVETSIAESVRKDRVFYEKCDTGDMESVRDFAKKVQEKFPAVHVLVNNGNKNFGGHEDFLKTCL